MKVGWTTSRSESSKVTGSEGFGTGGGGTGGTGVNPGSVNRTVDVPETLNARPLEAQTIPLGDVPRHIVVDAWPGTVFHDISTP